MAHRWSLKAPPVTGLVLPVRVDPEGELGPTRGQARGPRWRSTSAGLVVPSSVTDDVVEQRIIEAYAGAGPHAVVTGWAGLRLLGGGFFDGLARDGKTRLPVPIASNGARLDARPGVQLSHDRVPDDELVVIHGVRCAVAQRALFDEIRSLASLEDQVVAADMAFAGELTSIRRMQRYRWTRYWYRDVRRLDRVLPLSDEHARSRPEVDFRLLWVRAANWPPPLVNREVLDLDGGFVGIPDLLDVERGVAGEFAGADHRTIDQHADDLERAARFRRVGLETVEVVRRDLDRETRVVARMEEAAERAALLPRRWQLGPPPPDLEAVLARREARSRRRDEESG